jgi:4-hydroxybenzoate polyprenyltransferase
VFRVDNLNKYVDSYLRNGYKSITEGLNLIKSTRVHRTLTALTAIMVPVAFADMINRDIFLLFAVCLLVYAASGVQNAVKDGDYILPKKASKIFSAVLVLAALAVSSQNLIVFITFVLWVLLGLFYNHIARYFMFGDVTVLAITHHTLPTFSASMILGLPLRTTAGLSIFMFITFWFIIHLKNLKDSEADEHRGYKTITTKMKHGTLITKILFETSAILMFGAYFIFSLSKTYLFIMLGVFLLKIIITSLIDLNKHENALNLMRLMVIVFLGGLILDKTQDAFILAISAALGILYLGFLVSDVITSQVSVPQITESE